MKEIFKLFIGFGGYLAVAPLLGWALSRSRTAERAALCLLVFMTSWYPSKLTLMVGSVELYRGHTKGFEFSLMVGLGIALSVAAFIRKPPGFRYLVPGLWLYLLYCALSLLSLIPAANKLYGIMAAWKFTTAAFIFVGVFHAFRDPADLRWILRTLAGTLLLQSLVCLKMRYLDGSWQVHGWFEHQNPMAIWAYLFTIPLLAVAFSPKTEKGDTLLFLSAGGAGVVMILLSVSRGGLGALMIGAGAVTVLAFLRGFTVKKFAISGIGVCAAAVAGTFALHSLMVRIQEGSSHENDEDLRVVLNRQSKAMLHDSALGVGWNNFGVANSLPDERYVTILMDWGASRGDRIMDDNYISCPLTESLYWLLLSETGYFGFFSYIGFLALTLWWAGRGLVRHWHTPLGYFLGGLLAALTLLYLHGTVERVLTQTKNLSAWLIFVGFLARVEALHRLAPARAATQPTSRTFAVPGVAALPS